MVKRRKFIKSTGYLSLGILAGTSLVNSSCNSNNTKNQQQEQEPSNSSPLWFKMSLAQWSLNKALFAKELDHLDFAKKTRSYGLDGVEYVNQFFADKAQDMAYLKEMNTRANGEGIEQLMIMVDNEGDVASPEKATRTDAIDNHKKWVEAAKFLGCHSVRINLFGEMRDTPKWIDYATDGMGRLSEFAKQDNINIIVENHGWISSNAEAVVQVMKNIDMPNCGTLPDFGNFCLSREGGEKWGAKCLEEYDRYKGVEELMPYAKAVSAKSHDFDSDGNETKTDYAKMLKIVKSHGYDGYIGVEYEGENLSADEGIMATKKLLERVGNSMS
jgi:sugar phosphate isomerase/epimerase